MATRQIYALSRDTYWLKTIALLQSEDITTHLIECPGIAVPCLERLPAADQAGLLLVDASDFPNIVETVKQLRQGGWRHVVIVAARVAWQEARRAFTEGEVFDYWAKTYVLDDLRRDINDAVTALREGMLVRQASGSAAAGPPGAAGERNLRILHISDLHLADSTGTDQLLSRLSADLAGPLAVKRLNYLIVSGDISQHGDAAGLQAGRAFLDQLVDRFAVPRKHIIIVPGNHDLDCAVVPETDEPLPAMSGKAEPAAHVAQPYGPQFSLFNRYVYRPLLGQDYPPDSTGQGIVHSFAPDHLLVATLNSVCDTRQFDKGQISLDPDAIVSVLAKIARTEHAHQGWLRMAVWHRPVLGPDRLQDTAFLRLLAQHGVHVVLHGHVHESGQLSYERQGIRFVGAGACGMPGRRQVPPIPFGYNLLAVDSTARMITVYPRARASVDSDWQGDDRWRGGPGAIPNYSFPWVQSNASDRRFAHDPRSRETALIGGQ